MKINCTAGILTFNSAATLGRALESVKEFDDIVVCDGGSTDATLEIARRFGARVMAQDPQFKNSDGTLKDFAGVRNQLLSAALHDWFLYIDSDETISEGLREDVRRIAAESLTATAPLVYKVPYGILMDGKPIKYSSSFPGYQTRFFNKQSGAHFVKPVHERIVYPANTKVAVLAHPWYVHSTRDEWVHYVRETAKYRAIECTRAKGLSLGAYSYFVWRNVRTAAVTLVRALLIYLRHGFKETLPVRGELGRVLNPLILIWQVTMSRL